MSARLHIAWVVDTAGPAPAGGLVSSRRLIEGLRERHRVTVVGIAGDVAMETMRFPLVQELIDKNGFAIARPDGPRMRQAIAAADVVHVQTPFLLGFRALGLARALGVPVVAAHHVQPENLLANVGVHSPWLSRQLNRLLVRTFFNRADAVLCPSPFAREVLASAGLRAPATVISNGAPAAFAPRVSPRRQNEKFTILTVGRLSPEKRQAVILEAVQRARHAQALKLVVVGRGPLDDALRAQAERSGLEVELGWVSDARLLELYQTADLAIHASEVELEGLAVLEAMRSGCPTLIADSPTSAARQFATGPQMLFPPGDAGQLAERIDHCFEHPEALRAERTRSLDATRGLGIKRTLEVLDGLYHSVLRPGRALRGAVAILPAGSARDVPEPPLRSEV